MPPAFDINPSIDKYGLFLNIDMGSSALGFGTSQKYGCEFPLI